MEGQRELIFEGIKASVFKDGAADFGGEFDAKLVIGVGKGTSSAQLISSNGVEKLAEAQLGHDSVFNLGDKAFMIRLNTTSPGTEGKSGCFRIRSTDGSNVKRIHMALESAQPQKGSQNWFERKIDSGSADLYFHYYGTLQHQQNMLQDYIRTGSYFSAVQSNRPDFEGKVVMDVGAGSGMLSLFAAQAGAKKVYAVEASVMAEYARKLVMDNPGLSEIIEVVQGKVEEINIPEKMDVLISEPIGTLLVNERMLETYLYARDHFLKPGGKMFPKVGRIHVAAFSDEVLHSELMTKASFWTQENFYGVRMSSLHSEAVKQYFSQVVIDSFDPGLLVSAPVVKVLDFSTIKEEELYNIEIPLLFTVLRSCMIHGIACWFDIFFDGCLRGEWLSTAPGYPATHWFQLRCVLERPLWAIAGCQIKGTMRLVAHARQSYDIHVSLEIPPVSAVMEPQKASGVLDLKEPYYRQLTSWWPTQPSMPPGPHLDGDMSGGSGG